MEPIFFVVERTPEGETPVIYYDRLPDRLTSWKPPKDSLGKPMTDLQGKPIVLNPIIYALRLDRLPNGAMLAEKGLAELYALYRRLQGKDMLPPSNIADPPKRTSNNGVVRGEMFQVRNPPWHDQPRPSWLAAAYCVDCGDTVPPGRHKEGCRHKAEQMLNRDGETQRGQYIWLRRDNP
jgi:hypothetical protein